jgi:hypothetical protein
MSDAQALWEQLAEGMEASDPAISRSTMMGLPCLRIERGEGRPFAPAGKVFHEWLALDRGPEDVWRAALADAIAFAGKK